MNDMTRVIEPKSDQINADDLLAGPRTIVIRDVTIRPGTEQPVSIFFDGDNNKPYKCCKSMARVLVHAWGADAKAYVGRSLTLYCDPKVTWAGMAVGGIRISHMSHIDREMLMALTATKGKRAPFIVKPLVNAPEQAAQSQSAPAEKPNTETVGFVTWDGEIKEFPRNLGGIEQYVDAFEAAFGDAIDKAAWFANNQKLFHDLALGAVGSRKRSARCETLAARFDVVASKINDVLTVA